MRIHFQGTLVDITQGISQKAYKMGNLKKEKKMATFI